MSDSDQSAEVPRRRDVGYPPLALRRRGAAEPARVIERPREVARRMALAAMAGPLDEVLPARDERIARVERDRGRVGEEGELPQPDPPSEAEGEAEIVGRCPPRHRRQPLEVGPEVGDVLGLHPGIGGVRKGRIEVVAVRRDPALHGIGEVARRPAADAVGRVGRNVRHRERAEVGHELAAAPERQALVALGALGGVARRAAPRPEPGFPARRIARGERRERRLRQSPRRRGEPEARPARRDQEEDPADGPHRAQFLTRKDSWQVRQVAENRLHRRLEGRLVGRTILAGRLHGRRDGGRELRQRRLEGGRVLPDLRAPRCCAPGRALPSGK